jgi:hypothetical protein
VGSARSWFVVRVSATADKGWGRDLSGFYAGRIPSPLQIQPKLRESKTQPKALIGMLSFFRHSFATRSTEAEGLTEFVQ